MKSRNYDPSSNQYNNLGIKRTHATKVLFVFILILLSNASFVFAFYLVFGRVFLNLPDRNFVAYLVSVPFISIGALVGNDIFKMTRFFHRSRMDILAIAFRFTAFMILVTSTSAFALRAFAFPRSVFLVGSIILFIVTIMWELACMRVTGRLYQNSYAILIARDPCDAASTLGKIEYSLSRYSIDIRDQTTVAEQDIDGLLQSILPYPEIMITSAISESIKSRLILEASLAGKVVHLIPQYYELALFNATLLHLDDTLTFMIDRVSLTFEQRLIKRLFDLVFSVIVLLLTWPIMLGCWIAVRLDSPGPGIFKQLRITQNGRFFNILKFRTMLSDAEAQSGPVIATQDDPRVTRVGRFLRRSKLDELPQFWNVLKGDMSVVGPRSERPYFVDRFSRDIEGYSQRFNVKAGITGYAQIIGNYETSAEDKLRFDLIYIRSYSLMQDIRLIFETVRLILTPRLYKRTFVDKLKELHRRRKSS